MRLKGIFAGLIGGIILSGLLYYPCFVFLPGKFIDNWLQARTDLTYICLALSLLVLIFIGVAGGRWSGLEDSKTFLGGAASGGIAAMIAYGLIVSPTTGILGNKDIFLYGLVEVKDDLSLSWLVLYGVSGTLWWGMAGFWLSILLGLILGGIGGWVAEPLPDAHAQWSKLFSIIDPLMIFVAMINYIITYPTYRLFLETILKSVTQTRFSSQYPISVSIFLLNLTGYAWVLFWQLKLWRDLSTFQKQFEVQRLSWAFSSMIALIFPILLLFIGFGLMGRDPIPLLTASLSAVIGGLTFRETFWKKRSLPMPPPQYPLADFELVVKGGITLSVFMTLTLMMGNLIIPFNLVLVTITAISPLTGGGGGDSQSVFNMVKLVYSMPRTIFGTIFVANSLYFLLIIWTLRNTINFLRDYGFQARKGVPEQEQMVDAQD